MSSMKLTMQVSKSTDFWLLFEVEREVVDGVDRVPVRRGVASGFGRAGTLGAALGGVSLLADPDAWGLSGFGTVGVKLFVSLSDHACAETSLPVQHALAPAINK
jgi:hypothetical protein